MSWFDVGVADNDCATSQPSNMLLGPGSSAAIYLAFQLSAATEYSPSKQTVARCSRKHVKSHTNSHFISKGEEVSLGRAVTDRSNSVSGTSAQKKERKKVNCF
jgi:hypothetical protein